MGRRKGTRNRADTPPENRCRDCRHSYDWNTEALDGRLLLCRCPYMKNGGEFCIFLDDPQCELFEGRE